MSDTSAKGAKKRRVKLHETTLENDIRYIGPFTTQHFKLFGWLCIAVFQVVAMLKLAGRFDPVFAADSATLSSVLGNIANLSLPFLLIANFAQLINTENGYKKQLIQNGAAVAAICGLFYLVFYRYIVGGAAALLENPNDALPVVTAAFGIVARYGFFAFNLFVDLLLCTLTMFFLNYNPRRVFTGKARIIFRLFALLPIAYEAACMLLKVRSARGLVQVPAWVWPLLTVKPPMTFVLFLALAIFIKTRELRFRRHGKTHEEYQAFLKTRRNAWNVSVFMAIMLAVVSIADAGVTIGFSVNEVMVSMESNVEASLSRAEAGDDVSDAERLKALINDPNASNEELEAALAAAIASADAQAATGEEPAATQAAPKATLSPEERDKVKQAAIDESLKEEAFTASLNAGAEIAMAVGFGKSIYLILLAPLVLLFCYTRKPKNPKLDLFIPIGGIALIVFLYLEGVHQLLTLLPIKKINLEELAGMATNAAGLLLQ